MPDYTGWPTADDVTARLARAGAVLKVTGGDAAAAIAAQIAAVVADVDMRTTRQFIADAEPVTRYYDGSGTAFLEVDEFVTFVSATAIGLNADPGYPLANIVPVYEQGKPQRLLTRGQGGLPAFQVAAVYQPVPTIFPAGRQNIQVVCNWGYAATIPANLWEDVACEVARRLIDESIFVMDTGTGGAGAVRQFGGGDEKILYSGSSDVTKWGARYEQSIKNFKRRTGRRLRNLRPPMT